MSQHDEHNMHPNSLEAYEQEKERLGARAFQVLESYAGAPMTDRDVMKFLRFTDMNAVRPRITELVERGLLVECGKTCDPATGRNVRLTRRPAQQSRLF